MLGTGLQFGRIRSEDQVYVPVKERKNQNHFQKQATERSKIDETEVSNNSPRRKVSVSDKSSGVSRSNLEGFLESTKPSVLAQYPEKGWRTCTDVECQPQPYFTLGDLWESFDEWSAYGIGVPLLLDGTNSVIQYYVPYLSGIQLYGPCTKSRPRSRSAGEDSDSDSYRDTSSDGSSDCEMEKSYKFHTNFQHYDHLTNGLSSRMHRMSMSDEQSSGHDGFSSDDGESGNSKGCLLFEYLERDPPYCREPFSDKIMDLARQYPALKTTRSCDLLPLSWVSVAWYPIYRIPTGPTLKDLDACFLTYHRLSMPTGGNSGSQLPVMVCRDDGVQKICLPSFGMASYKFKGSMWTQNGVSEQANSLMQTADDWLRVLGVNHPDFQFFASHGMYSR